MRSRQFQDRLLLALGIILTIAIFVVDAFVPLRIAVAVLYVVVVLIAGALRRRRAIQLVTLGCMALTVLAFLLQHGLVAGPALARAAISLAAIAVTGALTLRMRADALSLLAQAELLDLTHDPILATDMDGVITYWNRGAEELYGWSAQEALGRSARELLRTRFPGTIASLQTELRARGRWQGELTVTRRDGVELIVASRWSLQRDGNGVPVAVLSTNNDVTERRHAEQSLHRTQAALAHVSRVASLGELTASIAHEVNQPLAAIVTNAEAGLRWLLRDTPDLGEVRAALERVSANGRRAGEVVQRVRALVRKAPPEPVRLDVGELVDESLALIQREATEHRVTVQVTCPPDLPPIQGDRVQLQQVLINLMVNAIQALQAVTDRPRLLCVRAFQEADHDIVIEIVDNGPGFDENATAHLFDAFFTTRSEGLGMGLSICRSILAAHGGRIAASRNPEQGATFRIVLPASGGT